MHTLYYIGKRPPLEPYREALLQELVNKGLLSWECDSGRQDYANHTNTTTPNTSSNTTSTTVSKAAKQIENYTPEYLAELNEYKYNVWLLHYSALSLYIREYKNSDIATNKSYSCILIFPRSTTTPTTNTTTIHTTTVVNTGNNTPVTLPQSLTIDTNSLITLGEPFQAVITQYLTTTLASSPPLMITDPLLHYSTTTTSHTTSTTLQNNTIHSTLPTQHDIHTYFPKQSSKVSILHTTTTTTTATEQVVGGESREYIVCHYYGKLGSWLKKLKTKIRKGAVSQEKLDLLGKIVDVGKMYISSV